MKPERIAALAIAATFVLRLIWLGDMEFNHDQVNTVKLLSELGSLPWSPLSPATAEHSGITHSAGFFYFVRLISGGSRNPIVIVSAISFFSAVCVSAGIWRFRRREPLLLGFCLLGASAPAIMLSRMIWTPSLVAAWCVLALLFLEESREGRARWAAPLGAFCLWMAPHMYLAAVFPAVMFSVGIAVSLRRISARERLRGWLAGCAFGALSFVPYVWAIVSGAPGSAGRRNAILSHTGFEIWRALKDAATLTTPAHLISRNLGGHIGDLQTGGHAGALYPALLFLGVALVLGLALYWRALYRVVRELRAVERESPAVAWVPFVVLGHAAALFCLGLGTFMHYWIAIVPFGCAMLGWAAYRGGRLARRLTWAYAMLSALAAFHFLLLIHERGGLPGGYGRSYRTAEAPVLFPTAK